MYRIIILTDNQDLGEQLSEWTKCFCAKQGIFPLVSFHENSHVFFETAKRIKPNGVIVALSGVTGLNISEQLRSLCPDCGLIWFSDLDFSLQAYRLKAEYFIKALPTELELCQGLSLWMRRRYLRN